MQFSDKSNSDFADILADLRERHLCVNNIVSKHCVLHMHRSRLDLNEFL